MRSLVDKARTGMLAARAEITARRSAAERLVALLHLLTSLALSAGYLLPAALLTLFGVWVSLLLWGGVTGLLPQTGLRSAGDIANTVAFVLLAPTAATLLARLSGRIQRSRLASAFGIVEARDPAPAVRERDPAPAVRERGPARALAFLFGREAWTAVAHSTITGILGAVSGGIAVGLVVYGAAVAAGSLLGLGYAIVDGSLDSAARPLALVLLGPVGALVGMWLVPPLVRLEVEVTRRLLFDAPEVRMRRRLAHVQDSRSRMVDAAEAERRRIERDLHDGAQQRLLAVTMTLTRARAKFDRDPAAARALLEEAQSESKAAMAELREVARGLHPRVLTDHGLEAALPVAAERCPLPVRVHAELPERPSARAEGVAYYVVCEALTNVTKHAGAGKVEVRAERLRDGGEDLVRITVTDDGAGGADPDAGTGLYGLWDRVNAVDGTLTVHSPSGEGTVLTADIPWRA